MKKLKAFDVLLLIRNRKDLSLYDLSNVTVERKEQKNNYWGTFETVITIKDETSEYSVTEQELGSLPTTKPKNLPTYKPYNEIDKLLVEDGLKDYFAQKMKKNKPISIKNTRKHLDLTIKIVHKMKATITNVVVNKSKKTLTFYLTR